jgi:hypothetical protein
MKIFKAFFVSFLTVIFFAAGPFAAGSFANGGSFEDREPPDLGKFSVKDGAVYDGEGDRVVEANELGGEIEGPIRFWAALGPESSEAAAENETGVWFFSGEGECLAFIPVEYESDAQGVYVSPRGDACVVEGGSPMRPDMFLTLYTLPDGEKKAEFAGLRGEISWTPDGVRFAFTRIDDDIREGGSFMNLAYGLRFSAVLYDTSVMEEVALKEATDTQNFYFGGFADDENVKITEEYVESEKDWADEEKIKSREIKVEIPPAG